MRDDSIVALTRSLIQEYRADGDPLQPALFEFAELLFHRAKESFQVPTKVPEQRLSNQKICSLSKKTGRRDTNDPLNTILFHGLDDVASAIGEDGGRIAFPETQGAQHDLLTLHRFLYGNRVKHISLHDAAISIGDIAATQSVTASGDPFDLTVAADCPAGRMVSFTVHLEAAGGLEADVTRELRVGVQTVLYACDYEQTTHGWIQDPTHTATTGAFVRIDPVATQFQPGDDTTPAPGVYGWITGQNAGGQVGTDDVDNGISATRSPIMNLSSASHVRLDLNYFHGQRDAGTDPGDYFRIDVSNDGGASWPANLVLVGDVTHTAEWRNLQVNLEEHLALTSQMCVRVQAADGTTNGDIVEGGLDDVFVYDRGDGNEPPAAPLLVAPPSGSTGQPAMPVLIVANAIDPEGDALTYGFQVFADAELTQLVAFTSGVPEGAGGQTSWTVTPPLAANQTYYWRAYAADPYASGLCMEVASFTVALDPSGVEPTQASALRSQLTAGPNPAHGAVAIRYYTPVTPLSRLEILDVSGRVVRTLGGQRWTQGWQETQWDGRDDAGRTLSGGLYWVRLVLPDESRTVQILQLR